MRASKEMKPFEVGMGIVHAVHGAGKIAGIESVRVPGGEVRKYLTVNLYQKGLVIKIPADDVESISVRHVAEEHQMEEVLRVLKSPPTAIRQRWNRDHSENLKKLKSGDLIRVAEVARDLLARAKGKSRLSILDQKLLQSVVEQICGEITCFHSLRSPGELDERITEVCDEILEILTATD